MSMNKAEKQAAAESLRSETTVLRQTRENYKEARANIEEKIKVLSERTQTQSVVWQRQYQESLKQQLDTAIDTLSTKNYSNIRQYLEGEYENGFIGTMYSMQKQGIPLAMPIDQRRVVKMVETGGDGIKLSKRLYGNTTKLKNAVRREVSIGLASGESYQDIAGRLSRTMGVDYNKTVRIARTEGGRVQNASRFDAMTGAKKSGADIVKQWDSTLDNRTRTAHRELDGQIRELEEPFEAEGQEAQHPHGFGVAWMDVNCRCVVVERARWAIDGSNPEFEDYTKFSRFESFDREAWINGTLAETAKKNGGTIVDLSDARNFAEFKQKYKIVSDNLIAQAAAVQIGVEVMGEGVEISQAPNLSVDRLPEAFTENKAAKNRMETFVEFINEQGVADSKMATIYSNLDRIAAKQGTSFKVKFGKNGHAVSYGYRVTTGEIVDAEIKIPMMKGANVAGQAQTTAHEMGHLIDHLSGATFRQAKTRDIIKEIAQIPAPSIGKIDSEITVLFSRGMQERKRIREAIDIEWKPKYKALEAEYDEARKAAKDPYERMAAYKDYSKKRKKLGTEYQDTLDYEYRNNYKGLDSLEDIYDALSGGKWRDEGIVTYGHGSKYYRSAEKKASEIWANYSALSLTRPDLVDLLKKDQPEVVKLMEKMRDSILEDLK